MPLTCAGLFQAGDLGALKVLITFGADVNALNAAKKTPVDMLKSPHHAVSDSLRRSMKDTRLTTEHRTRQRQVSSPTEVLPPPKLPQAEIEDTDFDKQEQKEDIQDDHETSNHFGKCPMLEELPQSDKDTLPVRPSRRRSLSLTSPPDIQAVLPPVLEEEPSVSYDHSHSQPSITGTLEKTTGYERMSDDKVGELVDLLRSAGAVSRIDAFHKKSILAKPLCKFSMIAFDDSSEKSTEYESATSKSVDDVRSYCLWGTASLKYFYEIRTNMVSHLTSIKTPLTNTPDEAIALAMQLREMMMFQMAGSRILFLDGGGLRGLLQIEILSQVKRSAACMVYFIR